MICPCVPAACLPAELWDDPEEDGRLQRYVQSLYRHLELPTVELGPGGACSWQSGLH
jgi:hypothetical protein